jgi:TRAP transporter 4TM/12TM fusion protein
LLGTINGSAVANVVTTGTFTIPLMRRAGFSAVTAGAVEAAASSAGQIIPPIMGAAAFLMAEIIGVPYAQIALAAALPAGLYVLALLVAVRLEAGRLHLARDEGGGLRLLGPVLLRRGYLLLPLIVLIVLLIQGFTPMRAAVVSLAVGLLLMPWSKETRVGPLGLVGVCVETLIATVPIIAAIAAAGVVIGVLGLTGLGLMLSGMILEIGGSNLWPVLLLTALVSFVLGMGLPTTAAYLLLAVLVAPALVKMGLPDISAHMFIFYYGLLSAITPPVALAG